ncbi:MAG: hypothetical protein G01um101431_728 [Parcubacteria group bacterium Gr01-1014_31]|nr:MAG: hypothetical protein G01um101431_728 [Parcubacteria group bacterium Gr01-1014_31]
MPDVAVRMPDSKWGFTPPASPEEAEERREKAIRIRKDIEDKLEVVKRHSGNQLKLSKATKEKCEELNAERMGIREALTKTRSLGSYLSLWIERIKRGQDWEVGVPPDVDRLLPASSRWQKPRSLAEAEDRLFVLHEDVGIIDLDLGDRYRRDPATGETLDEHVYALWAYHARHAKTAKASEVRYLNQWRYWCDGLRSGEYIRYLAAVTTEEDQLLPAYRNIHRPQTYREAQAAHREAEDACATITLQLSCPDRTDPDTGERLAEDRYFLWRVKAAGALAQRQAERVFLGEWMDRFCCLRDGGFWLEPFAPEPQDFAWYPAERRWSFPAGLLDALNRLLELRIAQAMIQVELSGGSRFDPETGELLPFHDFKAWEEKAKVALAGKDCENIFLQRWVEVAKAGLAHRTAGIPMGDTAAVMAKITPFVSAELMRQTEEAFTAIDRTWQGSGIQPESPFAAAQELYRLSHSQKSAQARMLGQYGKAAGWAKHHLRKADEKKKRITALNRYFARRADAARPLFQVLTEKLRSNPSLSVRERFALEACLHFVFLGR